MDGYERLADAVVIHAAKDYRSALRKSRRNPRNRDAMDMAKECERFFDSQWFSVLTAVDGSWLKERLRKEVAGA